MRCAKAIISVFVALTLLSATVYADSMTGYMSSIISNIGNLAPHVYHSQQRGYFVGGTMKIPPQGVTIQPFSITLPHISNNSCGGINAVMGGFSYLNFQYLVKKLQAIIQAAPALAFEIAIKVLSEKLGSTMSDLESVTNAINGLNFNSCAAMNGIVTKAANFITQAISGSAKEATKEQSNGSGDGFFNTITTSLNNIGQSLTKLWNDFKSGNFGVGTSSASTSDKQQMQGIPPYGLLASVAGSMGGLPGDFIDTMRYYLGDIVPGVNQTGDAPSPVGTWVKSAGDYASPQGFLENMADGTSCTMTYDELINGDRGECVSNPDNSLQAKIKNALNEIYNDLLNNEPISNPFDLNLIELSEIPVYRFMANAALLGGGYGPILAQQLSKPIALNVAAIMASRFLNVVRAKASSALVKARIGASQEVQDSIRDFIRHTANFEWRIYQAYIDSLNQAKAIYGDFMKEYNMMSAQVAQQLRRLQLEQSLRFQRTLNGS